MSATFAIDGGLPKVTLTSGAELWLGLQAVVSFVAEDGSQQQAWLPMPFWGFGRRIRSSAISLRKDAKGRTGIAASELMDFMKQDQAKSEDLGRAVVASLSLVEHGRQLAQGLPEHQRDFYLAQLEGFVSGVESDNVVDLGRQSGDDTIAA